MTTGLTTGPLVLVAGAAPDNANDRVVVEGGGTGVAGDPLHYIGVVSNIHTGSPTVTKSAAIDSALASSQLVPNLAGTVVYAVSGAGTVYAVNVSDASFAWTVSTGAAVSHSTPWLDFGTGYLYFANVNGTVTALNTNANGAVVFTAPNITSGSWASHSSPIVYNGIVWVGADDGRIYRLDATTGAVLGQGTNVCLISGSCTVNDAVYSGGTIDATNDKLLIGVNRRLIEIDISAATGCTAASATCAFLAFPIEQGAFVPPEARFYGSPAFDNPSGGFLYLGYANRLWRTPYNAGASGSFTRASTGEITGLLPGSNPGDDSFPRGIPVPFNNAIFVGDGGGFLTRFDTATFSLQAYKSYANAGAVPGGNGPAIDSTPVIDFVGNNLYFSVRNPNAPLGQHASLIQSFTSDDPVPPGPATRLRVTVPPTVAPGTPFSFTVTALDAGGNTATGYVGTVRFATSSSGSALPGNYTFTGADFGTRTFSATLGTAGGQTVTAIDTATLSIRGVGALCVTGATCGTNVASDRSAYTTAETVVASYGNMSGNTQDWIAVALPGSPVSSFVTFQYTGGGSFGSVTFAGLAAGTYVLRAFFPTGFAAESAQFTVGGATTTVTTNASSYVQDQGSIGVTYMGMSGSATDWIGLFPLNAPDTGFLDWFYTGGGSGGVGSFSTNYPAGTYVVRAYFNNTLNRQAESLPFTITTPGAMVSPSAGSYTQQQTVIINFSGMSGASNDWISIAIPLSPDTSFVTYKYTGGGGMGSVSFVGLPAGTYVARAYFNDNYVKRAESVQFTVTSTTTVTRDLPVYPPGTPVTITFGGMAGSPQDWIGIAPVGSPVTTFVSYQYTGGALMGQRVFNGLPPGNYVARAFFNDNYILQAESLSFIVQ